MLDVVLISLMLCLFPYVLAHGIKSPWVKASFTGTILFLLVQLYLPNEGYDIRNAVQKQTEVDKVTDGIYTTITYRTDCVLYQKDLTVLSNWFVITNIIRFGVVNQDEDLIKVEGHTCEYVKNNLLSTKYKNIPVKVLL